MEILKDLKDYPYAYTTKVKDILFAIKSKHIDTFYNKHVDGLREVYFFYGNTLPYEGVFSNANIYYEYSRMKYENPNMKTNLNLNVLFHEGEIPGQEGVFLNPQCLNLTKIHLDFNENDTTFLSKLQETLNKIGDEANKIYRQFGLSKETAFFIYFEKEGEINYPPFIKLCNLPQIESEEESEEESEREEESEEESEREARFRREHHQSLETAEATNQYSAFEFTDLDFNKFWEENKKKFVDGTYNITYGFLGIEKIERVTEEQTTTKVNNYKTFKSETCVLCLDEKAKVNVLFANCGHLCCCATCFALYTKNACPMCKTENSVIREI